MLAKKLSEQLKIHYGIDAIDIIPGPRGFVGYTYIIKAPNSTTYFAKEVNKSLFIPKIINSLETQAQLFNNGFSRMNHPIMTINGGYFIREDGSVLALYNYIDAKQSYGYDFETIGALQATLHDQDTKCFDKIVKEEFIPTDALLFESRFEEVLQNKRDDEISKELYSTFKKYEEILRSDYILFLDLLGKCQKEKAEFKYVVTHGDIGGNTLVKSPTDLYIIDWDEIILAPAERDIWTLWIKPEFQVGYKKVNPEFQINMLLYRYYIIMMNFSYLTHYINEIQSDKPLEHRKLNLNKMSNEINGGWIKPYLEIARHE